ncbi:uncharacterized protein [Salminus brasiliensis]|uniref:uncharacterized protein n=1 Tax=Salminus brasiliensis TaxID=930266 RepID=UPI003B836D95
MVRSCCVQGCNNKSHDGKGRRVNHGARFFKFPTWKKTHGPQVEEITKRRRMAWVSAVRRKNITFNKISPFMYVCSRHFHKGQPAYEMMETDPDWAPSLHLGHTDIKPTDTERSARLSKRQKQQKSTLQPAETRSHQGGVSDHLEEPKHEARESGQLDIMVIKHEAEEDTKDWKYEAEESYQGDIKEWKCYTGGSDHLDIKVIKHEDEERDQVDTSHELATECNMCMLRCAEVKRLLEENRALRCELNEYKLSDGFFRDDDDDKVQYYTGLPNLGTFMVLFNFLVPLMSDKKVLTPFQLLLLTLMRLRLDLPIQHLAHLFRVSPKTVSRSFSKMVSFLSANLRPSIFWADRDTFHKMMPDQFVEAFGHRVAVIIDRFEISTEKPPNLKAHAQMSSYKHGHTMKYLMGIAPNGSICFLSKGWGGCTSDKHIIENSGFLDNLFPGDVVLAAQGFDLQEGEGMFCAEFKHPELTKGCGQLAVRDVEETRRIEHLRITVKRLIRNVCQKYKILTGTIPIHMTLPCEGEEATFLDKIVTVCCALINQCPTMV